jgi:cytoskeletal protein CcmA (bactofilin family)
MFSKTKPDEPVPQPGAPPPVPGTGADWGPPPAASSVAPRSKPSPSVLAADLTVTGTVASTGDIHVSGKVEGDIRAAHLTIGEAATVKGEVVADEVVVHGKVVGRLRGAKVRLTASARVEGDIVHKTIAIDSGAEFEGSVKRQDDPVGAERDTPRIAGPRQPRQAAAAASAETEAETAPAK